MPPPTVSISTSLKPLDPSSGRQGQHSSPAPFITSSPDVARHPVRQIFRVLETAVLAGSPLVLPAVNGVIEFGEQQTKLQRLARGEGSVHRRRLSAAANQELFLVTVPEGTDPGGRAMASQLSHTQVVVLGAGVSKAVRATVLTLAAASGARVFDIDGYSRERGAATANIVNAIPVVGAAALLLGDLIGRWQGKESSLWRTCRRGFLRLVSYPALMAATPSLEAVASKSRGDLYPEGDFSVSLDARCVMMSAAIDRVAQLTGPLPTAVVVSDTFGNGLAHYNHSRASSGVRQALYSVAYRGAVSGDPREIAVERPHK